MHLFIRFEVEEVIASVINVTKRVTLQENAPILENRPLAVEEVAVCLYLNLILYSIFVFIQVAITVPRTTLCIENKLHK